jgi:antitoxin (DNA-binding transcriptional repressor) of toxin-antitoxin stability system
MCLKPGNLFNQLDVKGGLKINGIIFVHQIGTRNLKDMLVISTREFREKQGEYLGMVANGEDVILKSRAIGSFKIVPVTNDTLMSKEELDAIIERGMQDIKNNKGKEYSLEELRIKMGL